MDELKLTDTEQRYFSDLYLCCDHENTGKVTFYKATEFFQSSNIPLDVLTKITEIACQGSTYSTCDIINRKQFFAILKLIAAYQANIPLRREILNVCIELPLPRFTWPTTSSTNDSTSINNVSIQSTVQSSLYNNLNKQLEAFHMVGGENDTEMYTKNTDFTSTDSEVESQTELNNGEIVRLRGTSPGASSTASDSPTPTNSIQERSWGVAGRWQGPPCEEQRQLLATEEESSDGEVSNEVWSINSEQREYYTKQFISLQPDVDGIVPGHVARPFFEKSRLPVSELRRIWQLADVTRDGALNLDEFSIAMHLVVLRRNNISLPDVLPEGLIPQIARTNLYPQTSPPAIQPPPTITPPERQKDTAAREWTKFVDSPTSSISSPGPKPVNFDFHKSAVETDPKILHPVALRVTPEITPTNTVAEDIEIQPRKSPRASLTDTTQANEIRPIQRPQAKIKNTPGPGALPPPPDAGPMSLPLGPPRKEAPPPPPPRPLRTHTRSSSLDLNRLGRIPPAVPPRASPSPGSPVKRLVNQRSEGDILPSNVQGADDEGAFANFDHFIASESQSQIPETYENVLQSTGIFPGEQLEAERRRLFAQFTKVSTDSYTGGSSGGSTSGGPGGSGDVNDTSSNSSGPRKHGAFEVYRKPASDNVTPSSSTVASLGVNKKDMFRRLQEQNATLLRICQELSQELADVKEERIALTIRLEQQQQQQPQPQQSTAGTAGSG